MKIDTIDKELRDKVVQMLNDAADKSEVICCDEYGGEGVKDRLPARYNTAEKIDKWTVEFYVVAKDYSWTYIKTHECDLCGPYFYKITYEKKD